MAALKRVDSNRTLFHRSNTTIQDPVHQDDQARILDEVESQGRRVEDGGKEAILLHPSLENKRQSALRGGTDAAVDRFQNFWIRFTRKGRPNVGVVESLGRIATSHWLNLFIIFIPLSWGAHFVHWDHRAIFVLSFFAIIPLERLIEYGGDQMCFYVGKNFGDLIVVTLNNTVEATLAIILLTKCELRLLQSTIIGVLILHLLLIPGTAFLTGGARVASQDLHPHITELNHVLLIIGALSLLLPGAFWSALDRGLGVTTGAPPAGTVSDETRAIFLQISRGIAIILLLIYVASRIFLHHPPGEENAMHMHPDAPEELRKQEAEYLMGDPEVNQYVCIVMLITVIALMATTAEWLVESIEDVRETGSINEEWFGLVLLPIVSWSADGAGSLFFFAKYVIRLFTAEKPEPTTLAKARAIDLSIQFNMFWMPFIVLLAWWTNKSFTLLFDMFEVAVLLGACFLVNYVTADAKTNWAEGFVMVSLYAMIAICAWFYPGQPEIQRMLGECGSTIAAAAAEGTAVAGH